MQQRFDDIGLPPDSQPGRNGGFNPRTALLAFAFATFVLGGFAFGWLFMTNWRLLSILQLPTIVAGPGGPGIIVKPPPSIAGITRPQPTVVVLPRDAGSVPPPPEVAAKPENNFTDLPEWTR